MKIYVASSWRNEEQPEIVRRLREMGHHVYDFRDPNGAGEDTGFSWREIDKDWETWTPSQFREALSSGPADRGFDSDMQALEACDACLYVRPCGVSASLELGWAKGAGKQTVVILADGQPELMLKMADHLCLDVDEAMQLFEKEPEPKQPPALNAPTRRMLELFRNKHLPKPLRTMSAAFGDLAARIATSCPDGAEKTAALRKLVEAKDCAVRTRVKPCELSDAELLAELEDV